MATPDFCIRFHISQHRLAEGGNRQPGQKVFLVQHWYREEFKSFQKLPLEKSCVKAVPLRLRSRG